MSGASSSRQPNRRALRALVAEDEFLVSTFLEEMLIEHGHTVVRLCSNYASLEEACRTLSFDIAILDINLAGKMVYPIAESLRAGGKPFILLTGYGAHALPETLRGARVIAKPCSFELLESEMQKETASLSPPPLTLGDVLAIDPRTLPSEAEWLTLVRSIADGDKGSLAALYDRAHYVVYTLALRHCLQPALAEEITLQVFDDIEQSARSFDSAKGTVVAWMMNITRGRALAHRRQATINKAGIGEDVMRPPQALRERLVRQLGVGLGASKDVELDWMTVAPGIEYKPLACDVENSRISMLVRLIPDGSYPAHEHTGSEELHLLDGELWINHRLFVPGDFYRARAGSEDHQVWSKTGCTCVLTTSTGDILRPKAERHEGLSSA